VSSLDSAIETIVDTRRRVSADRCALVSISGIDASGKGYLTAKMAAALQTLGFRVANINIDGWLNLPHVRFDNSNPAEHFYFRAIRFEEMFRELIFPLRDRGSLTIEMDYAEETSTEYRKHLCVYVDIDIILLEGIFLLKRAFHTICRFGSTAPVTALERWRQKDAASHDPPTNDLFPAGNFTHRDNP
jgi:uridine kinase